MFPDFFIFCRFVITTKHGKLENYWPYCTAPTRVEFLFWVLLRIGMLFRVGTLYSRVSLRITSEAMKARGKSGRTCLLMSIKLRGHGGKIYFVSVLFELWISEMYKSKVASKLQRGKNCSKQCLLILFLFWFWFYFYFG